NASEQASRDDRLVDKRDADGMRAIGLRHRDGKFGGAVARLAAREIDSQVLDHGRLLVRRATDSGTEQFFCACGGDGSTAYCPSHRTASGTPTGWQCLSRFGVQRRPSASRASVAWDS